MKWTLVLLPLLLVSISSPAGSLSEEQVKQYLNGEGMGLARAAELNHHPGPKHVLEHSEKLGLTTEQKKATEELFQAMKREAVRLGMEIVEKEKELDSFFRSGKPDSSDLQKLLDQIASLNGRLRFTHLNTHLKMRAVLTSEQVQKYDALRGHTSEMIHQH